MSRPTLEVADIVRAAGNRFWEHHGSHLAWQHRKVLDAIVRCRTAALGGHRDQCVRCGHQAISYNSCRNRHCPRCQGNARSRWLAERRAELLPVSYFHIVFTLPHELSALTLQNKRLLYDLLFRASAATLLELARDPKHLGAEIGFLGVLHTWGQNLQHHPQSITSFPLAALLPLAPDGSLLPTDSSCPSVHSAASSAASSQPDFNNSSSSTSSSSTAHSRALLSPADSTRSCDSSSAKTGWSTSSHPSEALNMF